MKIKPIHLCQAHTHALLLGREKEEGETREEVDIERERAGKKTRRQLQIFVGDTCFLTPLPHPQAPFLPQQHL